MINIRDLNIKLRITEIITKVREVTKPIITSRRTLALTKLGIIRNLTIINLSSIKVNSITNKTSLTKRVIRKRKNMLRRLISQRLRRNKIKSNDLLKELPNQITFLSLCSNDEF